MNQTELKANTCSQCQVWENVCMQVMIAFGFTSDWVAKLAGDFLANHKVYM